MVPEELQEACPHEVSEAIISILQESILIIRQAGSANDADWCSTEANHIHNLPLILRHYSRSRLVSYLDWAQTGYTSEFRERFNQSPTVYAKYWEQLRRFLEDSEN